MDYFHRFSIQIPAYNRAGLLPATIDSVLAQSFTDFEIIVVDDGSSDGTPEVLASYGDRIKAIRQHNQGCEVARKTAARAGRGEYIVLLDSDDLLLPDALQIYDRIICEFKSPPVIIGALESFSGRSILPLSTQGDDAIAVKVFPCFLDRDIALIFATSHIVIRSDIENRHHVLPDHATAFPFEPCNIMLTLGSIGPCVAILKPITVAYRLHASNASGDLKTMAQKLSILIERERKGRPEVEARLFQRRAYIGGVIGSYVHNAFVLGEYRTAIRLIRCSVPLILAAVIRKFLIMFRSRRPLVIISPSGP